MTSDVFYTDLRVRGEGDTTHEKIRRLFDAAGFASLIESNDAVAVKLHFGERGTDAFLHPVHVRRVVDSIAACGGRPFLTDSNTLYMGGRGNAVEHLVTAIEHGFSYAVVRAPLIIADGLRGENWRSVPVKGRHFSEVKISGTIAHTPAMIVMSHFKGHEVAGFGGALKNLAMGCASPDGKQEQHTARAVIIPQRCQGCGRCISQCPQDALSLNNGCIAHDRGRCTGCFACLPVCPVHAIDLDWETDIPIFTERMIEYALGAVRAVHGRVGYMNFLIRVTPDCDCVAWSDASIVPDIGILSSRDPVAIDAASLDLVNTQLGLTGSRLTSGFKPGDDKFKALRPQTSGRRQIAYAEEMGLGTSDYHLRDISMAL